MFFGTFLSLGRKHIEHLLEESSIASVASSSAGIQGGATYDKGLWRGKKTPRFRTFFGRQLWSSSPNSWARQVDGGSGHSRFDEHWSFIRWPFGSIAVDWRAWAGTPSWGKKPVTLEKGWKRGCSWWTSQNKALLRQKGRFVVRFFHLIFRFITYRKAVTSKLMAIRLSRIVRNLVFEWGWNKPSFFWWPKQRAHGDRYETSAHRLSPCVVFSTAMTQLESTLWRNMGKSWHEKNQKKQQSLWDLFNENHLLERKLSVTFSESYQMGAPFCHVCGNTIFFCIIKFGTLCTPFRPEHLFNNFFFLLGRVVAKIKYSNE